MRADEASYINLQNARTETEAAKDALEETKTELDEEKEQLEVMEEELLEQLEEAHELIKSIEANLETETELYDQVVEEEERVQRQINAAVAELARQQEAERLRRLNAQNSGSSGSGNAAGSGDSAAANTGGGGGGGSGSLGWPTSGRVISNFGMRSGRMHQGTDFGAPHGASITAAESGTVITAGVGRGYGNYIVIAHGNGLTTLYAHNATNAVSVGQHVSRGQHIGTVGSTGNATTPHIHFEVSVNGVRVDPMTMIG